MFSAVATIGVVGVGDATPAVAAGDDAQLQICKQVDRPELVGSFFGFLALNQTFTLVHGGCRTFTLAPNTTTTVTEFQGRPDAKLCTVGAVPSNALVSFNGAAGSAVVTVGAAGSTTKVTFTNCYQGAPPPPRPGQLTVCKRADSQLLLDFFHAATVFNLRAGSQSFSLTGGNCVTLTLPAGPTTVSESPGSNFALCGVETNPTSALNSVNLAGGSANVHVTSDSNTLVTFRNCYVPPNPPPPAQLQICKQVDRPELVGSFFGFLALNQTFTLVHGGCRTITLAPDTTTTVTEFQGRPDAKLCNVGAVPSTALVSSNGAAGTAVVTVGAAGSTTKVTFTNCYQGAPPPPRPGLLTVCKRADSQLLASFFRRATVFNLRAGSQSFSLTGGNCVTLTLPAGQTTVSESPGSNFALCGVETNPTSALNSVNLTGGSANVHVASDSNTLVTFRNCYVPPPPPPTGELRVCKTVSDPAPAGPFAFAAASRGFSLSAGQCTSITLPPGTVRIVEAPKTGSRVCSIDVSPPANTVATNLPGGTADVLVVAQAVTTVTFRNCLESTCPPACGTSDAVVAPAEPATVVEPTAAPAVQPATADAAEPVDAAEPAKVEPPAREPVVEVRRDAALEARAASDDDDAATRRSRSDRAPR
ncbi:MAG TPA: hypothetical protein VM121_11110 [Acidimicrobiales bacterium]|nr:hypothetical protein [Acidimicrobiales bacterium]